MSSVTGRIKEIKQPYGGYIKPSQFEEIVYNDGKVLGEENVHASVIGMAVDYLTRFMMGAAIDEAFKISKKGFCQPPDLDQAHAAALLFPAFLRSVRAKMPYTI